MKIVINDCYGGFGLSEKGLEEYARLKGIAEPLDDSDIKRNDLFLIQVVESLGKDANGVCADLKIVEIPDDVEWIIQDYDGVEWVAEKHRTWR